MWFSAYNFSDVLSSPGSNQFCAILIKAFLNFCFKIGCKNGDEIEIANFKIRKFQLYQKKEHRKQPRIATYSCLGLAVSEEKIEKFGFLAYPFSLAQNKDGGK